MAAPDPPGWYRDPGQPDLMRYWDGTGWTARHRPRPAWTGGGPDVVVPVGGAFDDPVRQAEVQAPSAGLAAPSRQAPTGTGPGDSARRGGSQHPAGQHLMPAGGGGGGGGGGGTPTGGGGDDGPSGDGHVPGGGRRSRLKWVLVATIAVLAATVVGIAGEAMRPKSPGPRVLTDLRYMRLANAQCTKSLADLRPPDTGPFGQASTPAQTAAQIDRAAAGLDLLAGQLAAVPAAAVDRPHLDGWLAGWHRYTGLGRRYALFLRQNGNASPGQLIDDSVREARAADNFALANGLKSCTLFATPQPDPSNGF